MYRGEDKQPTGNCGNPTSGQKPPLGWSRHYLHPHPSTSHSGQTAIFLRRQRTFPLSPRTYSERLLARIIKQFRFCSAVTNSILKFVREQFSIITGNSASSFKNINNLFNTENKIPLQPLYKNYAKVVSME